MKGTEGHPGEAEQAELEDLTPTVVKLEARVVDLIKRLRWGRRRKSGWTPSSWESVGPLGAGLEGTQAVWRKGTDE